MRRIRVMLALFLTIAALACTPKPPALIAKIAPGTAPVSAERAGVEGDGWRIETPAPESVRLFELSAGLCDDCRLLYRARVKTQSVQGKVYLEMRVRVPGRGEFFSKGLEQPLSGTSEWTPLEIPFFLQKGEKPDLVRLNLTFEGSGGTAWIEDAALWKGPLP